MNLEKLKVEELNAEELVSVDGGALPAVVAGVITVIAVLDAAERFYTGWVNCDK